MNSARPTPKNTPQKKKVPPVLAEGNRLTSMKAATMTRRNRGQRPNKIPVKIGGNNGLKVAKATSRDAISIECESNKHTTTKYRQILPSIYEDL